MNTEQVKEVGKLKLSDVRKELDIKVSKNCQFDWFEYLALERNAGIMDFDVYLPSKKMNLQRPLVWTLKQKQELILSILKEIPVPKVSIIQYWQMEPINLLKIEVIDGKQRMCAFASFCRDEFPLESGHYFKDLDADCRMVIFRFYTGMDRCTVYDGEISDESKIAWFQQINFTGTPQDEEHLNNLLGKKLNYNV